MMPVTLLDLELDDWIDPSLPSNTWSLGRSFSDLYPLESLGPFDTFEIGESSPQADPLK